MVLGFDEIKDEAAAASWTGILGAFFQGTRGISASLT